MIHFSCDLCGAAIDRRYVVRIELRTEDAATAPLDLDVDPLEDLADFIEQQPSEADDSALDQEWQVKEFDLCGRCARQFQRDPLRTNEAARHFKFSDN